MTLRVMMVFGTRPEAIKMMPIVQELRRRNSMVPIVCVTGQHREMLDQVFSAFDGRPDINLDIMAVGQSLGQITANVLTRLAEVLVRERPDIVLVHGDTTTAFAAATAAFYARCKIGHVEAGLRSFDLSQPWPEEFNRVAIDAIADLCFAPSEKAAENLYQEYNRRGKVFITGNTGIDSLLYIASKIETDPDIASQTAARYVFLDPNRRLVLVTGHRRESFGLGFEAICKGLLSVVARGDVQIVYPVHLNPEVQRVVRKRLQDHAGIHLIDPVDYLDMVYLMQRASVVITDSGGIQEEGPALGRPVLVMREVTERPEAMANDAVKLIGTCPETMRREVDLLLDHHDVHATRSVPSFPFGDGQAAKRIVNAIEEYA